MFFVYEKEAHPAPAEDRTTSGRSNAPDEIMSNRQVWPIPAHRNVQDRAFAASECLVGMNLRLPVLIDTMDGVAAQGYHVTLGATAVVDFDGNLAFYWEGTGVHPAGAAKALEKLLTTRPELRE